MEEIGHISLLSLLLECLIRRQPMMAKVTIYIKLVKASQYAVFINQLLMLSA
jgi:hypothetical protein